MLARSLFALCAISGYYMLGHAAPSELHERQNRVCMKLCSRPCPCPAATPAAGLAGVMDGVSGVSPAKAKPSEHPRATTNEFLYVDFDETKDPDRGDMTIIHLAFQPIKDVLARAIDSIKDKSDSTFFRWFPDTVARNDNQDAREYVRGVFDTMFDEDTSLPRSVFKDKFYADNEDFANEPGTTTPRCQGRTRPGAYIFVTDSRFHVCQRGLDQKMIPHPGNCSSLDTTVSSKMRSLSHTLLHEFMHSDEVGEKAPRSLGRIRDHKRGAKPCFDLAKNPSKDQQQLTFTNSDSFVWFAFNAYYNSVCSKDFGDPVASAVDDAQDAQENKTVDEFF